MDLNLVQKYGDSLYLKNLIMAIENLSKPLILALAILCILFYFIILLLLFDSFLTAFLLYIASKEKKRLSPAEKRASKMAFAQRLFFPKLMCAGFLSLCPLFFLSSEILEYFVTVFLWSVVT